MLHMASSLLLCLEDDLLYTHFVKLIVPLRRFLLRVRSLMLGAASHRDVPSLALEEGKRSVLAIFHVYDACGIRNCRDMRRSALTDILSHKAIDMSVMNAETRTRYVLELVLMFCEFVERFFEKAWPSQLSFALLLSHLLRTGHLPICILKFLPYAWFPVLNLNQSLYPKDHHYGCSPRDLGILFRKLAM